MVKYVKKILRTRKFFIYLLKWPPFQTSFFEKENILIENIAVTIAIATVNKIHK